MTLVRRQIPADFEIPSVATDHAVSPDGTTLFFRPAVAGALAGVLLDSLGSPSATFGRLGEGPDEYRFPVRMFFDGSDTALIFDASLQRLTRIDRRGKVLSSAVLRTQGLPISTVGDSLDIAEVAAKRFSVVRLSAEGGERVIVSSDAPMLVAQGHFSQMSPRGQPIVPVFGSNGKLIVVANPWTYALVLFADDGSFLTTIRRDLPTLRRTERQVDEVITNAGRWRGPNGEQLDLEGAKQKARAEVQPFFSHVSPIGFDLAGRVWVVGTDGDSAFADVFAGARFVTRLALPCFDFAGRWAIHGHWLSMACGAARTTDSTSSPTMQLYRIDYGPQSN